MSEVNSVDLVELDVNEVVKLTREAMIKENLKDIKKLVIEETQKANSLVATEENKGEVKKVRTSINKIKTDLENRRKSLKKEILKPYEQFEKIYIEEVKSTLDNSLSNLDSQISTIEEKQLSEKTDRLLSYFNEIRQTEKLLSYIEFDRCNIKITLSATEVGIKKAIRELMDAKLSELQSIAAEKNEEKRHEVLKNYISNGYNLANAILKYNVNVEIVESIKEKEKNVAEKDDEIIQEIKVENNEPDKLVAKFKVTATLENLKALKEYMLIKGIEFETIK